jgi:hypothetical protein
LKFQALGKKQLENPNTTSQDFSFPSSLDSQSSQSKTSVFVVEKNDILENDGKKRNIYGDIIE